MVNLTSAIGQGAVVAVTIKAIDKFSETFNKTQTGLGKIASVAKVYIGVIAGVAAGISAMGVASVKAAADFEQSQIAFTTMLGSAEAAESKLKELADFAKKTPFTLPGVERSARQLLAVGFEADDLLPTLKNVGDVASGLGLGEEGLQRLILNLGQVQSQGKLTGRELRDFAVAGVPLLDELAKQLGTTTANVQEMISAGEITTDAVLKAFETMSSEGGRFANLMEKQSTTVVGMVSNIKDSFSLMARELGKEVLPIVKDLADTFLNDVMPSLKPLIPLIGEALKKGLDAIIPLLPKMVDFFIRFVEVTLKLFDAIQPLLEPLSLLAFAILEPLIPIFEALIPLIEVLSMVLVPLLELLAPIVKLLADVIKFSAGFAGKGFQSLGNFLGNTELFGGRSRIRSVGDAILRPNGEIIETHPQDTLIATKGGMGGTTIIIEGNLIGLDEQDIADRISRSMQSKLNTLVRK